MSLSGRARMYLEAALADRGYAKEVADAVDAAAVVASNNAFTGTNTHSGAETFTGGVTVSTANVTITDVDVALSATTGTKIGTATTQKLAFFNSTPVVQRSAYTQTYATADKTHANPTATALTHSAVGGTADGTLVDCTSSYSEAAVEENFKELATAVNLIIADLADVKQLVNSVVDDLQALGLVG